MAQTTQSAQSGMSENVAAFLCYLVGWVTGIIFFLIDKRPFVRFHAAQSIVVFGGLHILNIVIGIFFFRAGFMMMGGFGAFGIGIDAVWPDQPGCVHSLDPAHGEGVPA